MKRRMMAGFLLITALTTCMNTAAYAEGIAEIVDNSEERKENNVEVIPDDTGNAEQSAAEENQKGEEENSEERIADLTEETNPGESIEEKENTEDTEAIEYVESTEENDTEVEELQLQIDALPDLEEYDYLPLEEKEETKQQVDNLKETYFEEFTDEQRNETDASSLLSLDIYTESYAYYQTEEEYDGQLTLNDQETCTVSDGTLQNLQQQIDALPDVGEITSGEGEVSYTGDGSCLAPEETDELYQEVYDAASVYYKLPEEQAETIEGEKITALTAYFSVGVSTLASSPAIGSITYYENPVYYGTMTTHHPHYGYYEVSTENSEGEKVAFCMDSNASTPGAGGTPLHTEYAVTDIRIRTILYYGYGGPEEMVDHTRDGYCETHMAICYAMDYDSSNNQFAKAAFDKLYTNAPDPNAGEALEAWAVSTGVAGTQDLVYAKFTKKHTNTLTIRKFGAGKTALQGAVFELSDAKTGEILETGTTNAEGEIVWENLSDGDYQIREIKSAAGYELLKEPLTVTLPLRMTEEEAEGIKADTSGAYKDTESGQWCFPERICEITDSSAMTIPYTGGRAAEGWSIAAAEGTLMILYGVMLLKKRKMLRNCVFPAE